MTRTDRIIEIATAIVAARAEVTRLEGELEELAKDNAPKRGRIDSRGTSTRPGRRSRKEEPSPTTSSQRVQADGGAAQPPKANASRQPDPIRGDVVRLAKQGFARSEIAEKLGLKGRAGSIKVANQLAAARRAGDLPKAVASR